MVNENQLIAYEWFNLEGGMRLLAVSACVKNKKKQAYFAGSSPLIIVIKHMLSLFFQKI